MLSLWYTNKGIRAYVDSGNLQEKSPASRERGFVNSPGLCCGKHPSRKAKQTPTDRHPPLTIEVPHDVPLSHYYLM